MQVVDALVPLAEMFQYVSTLRGMTKGRASYIMQLAKFDVVPQHIQNQLASKEQEVAAWLLEEEHSFNFLSSWD